MLAPNTILRERYRIIHQLGHGGMGAVYQAMDENLSCVVAVKETFATTDEQRRAFRREAELLANLSHPTLPRVMDHFTHGEGQFLVMQFVPGHDLAELLELREQPFAVAKVIEWADQLLDALEELHSSNPPIVHRDIKPANLKVTPKGKVLLLDFGLAKGVAGQMSTADVDSHGKSIYGYTPNYAPLEQIRGRGTDPRSDLYSLAATMWTLLTGEVPPDALSRVAEKEEGNQDPLRAAHEINPQVPMHLSNLLGQAMSLNRNQRPAKAAEMRNALSEVRQAEFERSTLPLPRPNALKSTSLPASPPPERTKKAPEPAVQTPSSPHVPTMRVDSPPAVPTWERDGTPATANSFAGEAEPRKKRWKPAALIVTGVLVLAIAIGLLAWRPWAGKEQSGSNGAAKTNQQAGSTATNNPAAPAGMVYVPGGQFMMGRDDGDEYERPAHKVTVKPFFIDVHEVTLEDYMKFVRATGRKYFVADGTFQTEMQHPASEITWYDAVAYAQWAGKRLPSEEEWEFAARGNDGRRYPWGNEWKEGLANTSEAKTAINDVGRFKGTSPFGLLDMVGNVWEWTASNLGAYPGGQLPKQITGDLRVIRGGSYTESKGEATTTYRRGYPARGNYDYTKTGFRCAKDPTSASQ
ncbi:MAG TPA: bifunctional serine/threonine-protein kinase/formylglycine-generating enzyme family protein [Pyrinomonadaceae bacterium]|nr:bifunctional serine/threonine-protein kinase/formylglycine-generating enzyme family protein [Pyrinomonadaceae bacterium]